MATAIRETRIRVDLYTREILLQPDEPIVLYQGDQWANKLVFVLENQGQSVHASGYTPALRYIRPDATAVVDSAQLADDGTLQCMLPPAVYAQIGLVTLTLTLIDENSVATAFEMRLRVREKIGLDVYEGVEFGDTLPSYEKVIQLIRQLEEALGLAEEGTGSGTTIATRFENIEGALSQLQAFEQRPAGFATAEQGTKAEQALQVASAALPAVNYNASDVLTKVKTLITPCNLGAGKPLIPAGANLDNYTTPGSYTSLNDETTRTLINRPSDYSFQLDVSAILGHSVCIVQTVTTYNDTVFMRRKFGDTWNAWRMTAGANVDAGTLNGQPGAYFANMAYVEALDARTRALEGKFSHGTWTPTLVACGTTITAYEFRHGTWDRVGRVCTLTFAIRISNASTQIVNSTGVNALQNLPFVTGPGLLTSTINNGHSWDYGPGAKGTMFLYVWEPGYNACLISYSSGAALSKTEWVNAAAIYGTITYIAS